MRLIWGPYPLSVSALYESMGSLTVGETIYPTYNIAVIVVGGIAAAGLWAFVYRTQFGVVLRATSQNMRMASALGVNVNRVYVQAFTLGCFMAGLAGAIVVPQQGAVLGMGVDALILAFVVVVIGGLGSLEGALVGALLVGVVRRPASPSSRRSSWPCSISWPRWCCSSGRPALFGRGIAPSARGPAISSPSGLPAVALLIVMPFVATPYQTVLLSYGLVYAIAALGFNLLLGYTGLLSFGHCAYFGVGAYAVAFMVKYFKWSSMEVFVLGGVLASAFVSLIFGFLCVRYTRIFFGILTMALSQVLWSLAFKFFWFTGGSDGLRVPTPTLLGGIWAQGPGSDKFDFLSHRYYFYVLALFVAAVVVMWLIVHSPFGKALQAIRDNETRAEFVGVQVRRYRLVAFVASGIYTGLAGALWVPLNGLTTPDILHWTFSGKIVFFTVLGGFQTFAGPIIGAIAFNYLEVYAVGHTVYWQLVLGVVLVALVLVLPAGIVGSLLRWLPRRRGPAA